MHIAVTHRGERVGALPSSADVIRLLIFAESESTSICIGHAQPVTAATEGCSSRAHGPQFAMSGCLRLTARTWDTIFAQSVTMLDPLYGCETLTLLLAWLEDQVGIRESQGKVGAK